MARADSKTRHSTFAQRPIDGTNAAQKQARSLELFDAIRKQFGGDPVINFEGSRYVRLPSCETCKSWRWDDIEQRWYHDSNCATARALRQST